MKAVFKYLAGAASAAALTVTAASPAQAQYYDPYRRDRGIEADIVTGVAVLGGIAAILSAFGRDGDRYGYGNRYRYRNDYTHAVNSCAYQAERYGAGGRVEVTHVDRRGMNSYRVEGVIDAGYGGYGDYNRYGRYDDRYGRYDDRYGRYDPRYDRYGRSSRYGRYDRYGSGRLAFQCNARADGRITGFDIDRI